MSKILILVLVILLALGSLTGYLLLTAQVTSGQQKIDAGEKQLAEGQQALDEGKARLANGERRLSAAKSEYREARSIPFLGAIPIAGAVFNEAGQQISQGQRKVTAGAAKVASGEAKLNAGKLELNLAKERLNHANYLRLCFAISAICFFILGIWLGYWWRLSLIRHKSN